MGMFDYMTCRYPLRPKSMQHREFQTKSLGCVLARYAITTEGQLCLHDYHYEVISPSIEPEPLRHNADLKQFLDYLTAIDANRRYVDGGLVSVDFTGTVIFYAFESGRSTKLVEYKAIFERGKIQGSIGYLEPWDPARDKSCSIS